MKKQIMLTLLGAAMLTACHNDSTPNAASSVSGTVVEQADSSSDLNLVTKAWTGGAGQVKLQAHDYAGTILATATLNSNGLFSLALPSNMNASQISEVSSDDLENENCQGNAKFSDPSVKGIAADLTVTSTKNGIIESKTYSGTVNPDQKSGALHTRIGGLIYVDRSVKLTGSAICNDQLAGVDGTLNVDYNLSLSKGWNLITESYDGNISNGKYKATLTFKSGSLPTNNWLFDAMPFPNGLRAQPQAVGGFKLF